MEEPGQAVVAGEVGVGVDGVEEGEEGGLAKGGDEEAVLGESRAGGSEEGVGNRGEREAVEEAVGFVPEGGGVGCICNMFWQNRIVALGLGIISFGKD